MQPKSVLKDYDNLLAKHGSQRRVAKALGIPRSTLQDWLNNANRIIYSEQAPKSAISHAVPKRGIKRFILSAAQDETAVHEGFLANLEAYAAHMNAKIVIAGFTYNKPRHFERTKERQWFAPEVEPYLCNRQIEIGDNLLFCGEMNTLPTATTPLTGFETYTRDKWGVFPHPKVQLLSVATLKGTPAKQLMTTGAVTKPNYLQARAGIRAHFHHVLGAVIVEVDADGDHFCRHLIADDDGSFYDLTRHVANGEVTDGHRVEAITWGDIHHEQIDPVVREVSWGLSEKDWCIKQGNIIDTLRPKTQFLHDLIDFFGRNHHSIHDPNFMFARFWNMQESIKNDIENVAEFLVNVQRDWCKTVVVRSNHDLAIERWCQEADWKTDPINAEFYLEAQLERLRAIKQGRKSNLLEWAIRQVQWGRVANVKFLAEDESYLICGNQIEAGLHGHNGANGSRGSLAQYTKAGPKTNTGHSHTPGIRDGAYSSGTSSKLDLDYTKGMSSWAHAHLVTYQNGKRTILNLVNGKYCA